MSKIRAYHPTDHAAVMHLLRLNTPEYFAPEEEADLIDYLSDHLDRYFVVEAEGKILGCGGVNLVDNGQTARISWDIIHPESQGQGIGRALTEFRIAEISKIESVQTIVVRTSQLAYKFYERLGFELKEVAKGYWAPGFDMYYMERTIRP